MGFEHKQKRGVNKNVLFLVLKCKINVLYCLVLTGNKCARLIQLHICNSTALHREELSHDLLHLF